MPDAERLLDTIATPVVTERQADRSRFIATLAPVTDEAGAGAVLAEARHRWHDARHHAMAVVLGPDGRRQRSNDDGEPAGTAGAPMLAVLTGADLSDVVAVVTRYFGGTLLGTGGLARAYGGAVRDALARVQRVERVPATQVAVTVAIAEAGRVEHLLRRFADEEDAGIQAVHYGAGGARLELIVPVGGALERLEQLLASAGAGELTVGDRTIRARVR